MSRPPETDAADSLDRALAALEWTLQESWRETLGAGETVRYTGLSAGFCFVSSGVAEVDDGQLRGQVSGGDLILWPHGACSLVRAVTELTVVRVIFAPNAAVRPPLAALPPSLLVREFAASEPAVTGLIEDMACGPVGPDFARAGDAVICSRIATTIVSVVVRAWIEGDCAPELWADRLADPGLDRVLDAVHADPGKSWTVDELARTATMSRSAFAERFRALTGRSPASYLAGVRMDAAMKLLSDGVGVAATAHRLGYESEAGFSRAFRRHTGLPPARWRRHLARRSVNSPG